MNPRSISEDDLHAYVDGVLEARRASEVEAYLKDNPLVAERVADYARQRDALRQALGPVAAEPLPHDLNLSRMIDRAGRARRLAPAGLWRSAAAAVVILSVGAAGGWSLRGATGRPKAGIASLAQEASDSYAVYATDLRRPVELDAASQVQLTTWASDRLARPVSVPDLSKSGYRFLGGRLVSTPHGPAVLYMFDDGRGARLVMLIRKMTVDKDTPFSKRRNGQVASVSWSRAGLGFSLVGAVAPAVLAPVADRAKQQVDQVS